jgi:hypothetical protein
MQLPLDDHYVAHLEYTDTALTVRFVSGFSLRRQSSAFDLRATDVANMDEARSYLSLALSTREDVSLSLRNGRVVVVNESLECLEIHADAFEGASTSLTQTELQDEALLLRELYERRSLDVRQLRDKLQDVQEVIADRLTWVRNLRSKPLNSQVLTTLLDQQIKFLEEIHAQTEA